MKPFNILFTSAGRRVSLIQAFKKALSDHDIVGNIIAVDGKRNAPALYVADFWEQVPRVISPVYINHLLEICKKYQIKLLIPLIDTELEILSTHKLAFEAVGVTVLVSSEETNQICCDKRNTYNFFKKMGIQTPKIYDADQILQDPHAQYPFIIKPADGSSSEGVTKVKNAEEVEFFNKLIPNAIVQEYLTGEEFTLDILTDLQGRVFSVVPRLRIETRAGEISKGVTVKDNALIAAGKRVVSSLPGAFGCLTAQCFLLPSGEISFIEINPRFGGGFPLSFHAGANFPGWIIEMMHNHPLDIEIDQWREGVTMLRYDDAIFLEKEMIECVNS
jgi:carbamoyl-phosphate synthase large subunit